MNKLLMTGLIFLACSSLAFAKSREPKIAFKDALSRAETYAKDHELDTSDLFLKEVSLKGVQGRYSWMIIWAPKSDAILDGELRITVFDDGKVIRGE